MPFALNHLVLYRRLDRMSLPDEDYDALFDDVCVMAAAAIEVINENATADD